MRNGAAGFHGADIGHGSPVTEQHHSNSQWLSFQPDSLGIQYLESRQVALPLHEKNFRSTWTSQVAPGRVRKLLLVMLNLS